MQTDFDAIALVGFSTFEYATFETFFRLVSGRRARQYRAVRTGDQARLVVVDGGNASLVTRLVERLRPNQTAIIIGFSDHGTGLTVVPRPINLSMVLSLVDRTFAAFAVAELAATVKAQVVTSIPAPADSLSSAADLPPSATAPAITSTSAPQADTRQNTEPTFGAFDDASTATNLGASGQTIERQPTRLSPLAAPASSPAAPIATAPAPLKSKAGASVLVVDDSEVALKFIRNRLSAFGFNVDLAKSGEEALVQVSENQYSFVFLDVMMDGLDGYQTCKAIKKRKFQNGHSPVVVMLTSRGGTVDKVRGTFAGCDAYLTKPLDETKMLRILLKHDPELSGQIETRTQQSQGRDLPGASSSVLPAYSDRQQAADEEAARVEFLARLDKSSAIR